MLHPAIRVRESSCFTGLETFALTSIPAGTAVWIETTSDRAFSLAEVRTMDVGQRQFIERYAYVRGDDRLVLCGDDARYTNHSCDANTLAVTDRVTLATRNIGPGEAVVEDYATFNRTYGFICRCGAPTCRGRVEVYGEERCRLQHTLTEKLRSAIRALNRVPQPLWPLLSPRARAELSTVANRRVEQLHFDLGEPLDVALHLA